MSVQLDFARMATDYNNAGKRLLIFDSDGTLTPFQPDPGLTKADSDITSLIDTLASDRRNHVMVLSGRDRQSLAALWNGAYIILVAEHGGYYKTPGNRWHQVFAKNPQWISRSLPSLSALCFEYEGSFVEEKSFSLAWHYRSIADKISSDEKNQILTAIKSMPHSAEFMIYEEDCVIELRTPGIDKGRFVSRWIGNRNYDFIMAVGDGSTDEDIFKQLGNNEYTIKVGASETSAARFQVANQTDVPTLMSDLLETSKSNTFRTKL